MNDDIQALTSEWIGYLRASDDVRAADFYCTSIAPALMPGLRERFATEHGRKPQYDGLVSLLGFTPETVALAYLFTQPKTVVILHTAETTRYLDTVVRYTKVPMASFFHEPFKEQPSRDIYLALERALQRFAPGSKIAIELTGGKKTMGGALAVAAGMLDLDLLYIDYEEYMPEFRKPKPASTYIHLVENPMRTTVDLFGGLEIQRALEFFNLGKLEAAEELLNEAAKRMGSPRVAELCARLARFYSSWNRFDFAGAARSGAELFEQALRFHQEVASKVTFDLHRLKVQLDTVQKLSTSDRTSTLLNFFFTAERYEQNSQHDIAALLYYRTLEGVFENRLRDRCPEFKRESPNYDILGVGREELVLRFSEAKTRLMKRTAPQDLPERLALLDTIVLLDALGDECFVTVNRQRVLGLSEVRNHSIFAHGVQPLTAASIEGLKKLSAECLGVYLFSCRLPRTDECRGAFTFMTLNLRGRDGDTT